MAARDTATVQEILPLYQEPQLGMSLPDVMGFLHPEFTQNLPQAEFWGRELSLLLRLIHSIAQGPFMSMKLHRTGF